MPLLQPPSIGQFLGMPVRDTEGRLLGHVHDVLVDAESGEAEWLVVDGPVWAAFRAVPLARVRQGLPSGSVNLTVDHCAVLASPRLDELRLDADHERRLLTYWDHLRRPAPGD